MKSSQQIFDEVERRIADNRRNDQKIKSDRAGSPMASIQACNILAAEWAELISLREFILLP